MRKTTISSYKALIVSRLRREILRIPSHPIQSTRPAKGLTFLELGSSYGNWVLVETQSLMGSTIVSAGLGEDASFDVEFARHFGGAVIIVDPTPRAIHHFHQLEARFGKKNSMRYSSSGKQPVESYDLKAVRKEQLRLVEAALWLENGEVTFYAPPNSNHVSHSISNFQNDYSSETPHISVSSKTLETVIAEAGILPGDIRLLKLDIEGAEIEVIQNIFSTGIFPEQLLVEFDEIVLGSERSFTRVNQTLEILNGFGYRCVWGDGSSNFTFLRTNQAPDTGSTNWS